MSISTSGGGRGGRAPSISSPPPLSRISSTGGGGSGGASSGSGASTKSSAEAPMDNRRRCTFTFCFSSSASFPATRPIQIGLKHPAYVTGPSIEGLRLIEADGGAEVSIETRLRFESRSIQVCYWHHGCQVACRSLSTNLRLVETCTNLPYLWIHEFRQSIIVHTWYIWQLHDSQDS